MNTEYFPQKTLRLHSPLLDGICKNKTKEKKGKVTYFDPNTEGSKSIDETLDSTIYTNTNSKINNLTNLTNKGLLNLNKVNNLEITFKIASTFITAIGGTFCLLQLIEIIRIIQNGSLSFGNNLLLLVVALIITITANVICAGFAHLVKTTKYIFVNLESNNAKLNKLVGMISK